MKNKDDLVYDLIFSDSESVISDLSQYIKDIYQYDEFIDEIKQILQKSKVTVVTQSVDVDSITVTWKLKVKK